LSVVRSCNSFNLPSKASKSLLNVLHAISEDTILDIKIFIEIRSLAVLIFQTRKLVRKIFDFDSHLFLILFYDAFDIVLVLI